MKTTLHSENRTNTAIEHHLNSFTQYFMHLCGEIIMCGFHA